MQVGRGQCIAIWNTAREEILFIYSLRGSIGILNTKSDNIEIFAGNIEIFAGKRRKENQKLIDRDGCDRLFAQPTGICIEWNTVTMDHSAAKKLTIVVPSSVLNKYFHQSHNFSPLFGIHRKKKKP